jgi:hypothetical protein
VPIAIELRPLLRPASQSLSGIARMNFENAKHNRVMTAILLTLASPEYIAQK